MAKTENTGRNEAEPFHFGFNLDCLMNERAKHMKFPNGNALTPSMG
jgi:hypothetical protein